MHEHHQPRTEQQPQEDEATEAAKKHWRTLANPAGLQAEFASNYLGCWPSREGFTTDFAQHLGIEAPIHTGWAERLADEAELAFVPDEHGTHVFVHPSGGPAPDEPPLAPVRHLRLVPDLNDSRSAHPAGRARHD